MNRAWMLPIIGLLAFASLTISLPREAERAPTVNRPTSGLELPGVSLSPGMLPYSPVNDPPNSPRECQEDDPCWNCTVNGNKVCGPIITITLSGVR